MLENSLWRNEPWLVKAYGPTLLAAAIAARALFVAIRRDGSRGLPA